MIILTINCGSSSLKYQVYDWAQKDVLAVGIVERVTMLGSLITHKAQGKEDFVIKQDCPDHKIAIALVIKALTDANFGVIKDVRDIKVVGHRFVHGGTKFTQSTLITPEVLKELKTILDLAPLHNPAHIMGIEATQAVLGDTPQCIILDTAWHQTMPEMSYMYAVPREWYEKYAVRRYGFHGTSYLYTAKRAAVLLGKDPKDTNLIIAHIGNGASINAVKNGVSFDTSMGMTPLEGLMMGTRSGDIDAGIIFHVMRKSGLSPAEVEKELNKESGILGITGQWTDRRDVEAAAGQGNKIAQLALDIEGYRIKKYIGAFSAGLGRVDALVFTAGVGEMSTLIRELACAGLENIGIKLDKAKNNIARCRNAELEISTADSPVKIFVIATDEELIMTEDCYALMTGSYKQHTQYKYIIQDKNYVNKSRAQALVADLAKKPFLKDIIAQVK